MTTSTAIRVFISSPGDVAEERAIAERVLKRISDRYADLVNIEPIFWEHEPLLATDTFQAQIPPPSAAEVFICILWSRLGTRLPESVRRGDGSRYHSGTEFEFEDAITGFRKKGMPDLIVYRKTAEPVISLRDRDAVMEALKQGELLDAFIQQWFHGTDGTFQAAFHPFKDPSEFEEHLELHLIKLVGKRLKHAGVGTTTRARVTWSAGSPYRGLEAYDVEHEPVFFGRTAATSEAIRAIRQQAAVDRPFLLILGASGSGKSSLARAGVLPMLTRPGVVPGIAVWRRAIMSPSDANGDLFVALTTALLRQDALPDLLRNQAQTPAFAMQCSKDSELVVNRIVKSVKHYAASGVASLVLVIDQLEEIFTLKQITESKRALFFGVIEKLVAGGVWVIATLRSDFYHLCSEIPELSRLKSGSGQFDVQSPTPTEIAAIIRQPAIAAGLRFEQNRGRNERLQDLLADDAARCPESLPLLSFTLDELYKRRSEKNALRLSVYLNLGRLEGALAHRATEVFASLPKSVQSALPRVFRQLVTLGAEDNSKAVRKPAPIEAFRHDSAATEFLKAFIEARLFSTKRDADRIPIVEITHEALLSRWKPVQKWLEADRENLRVLGRLKNAATVWEESKRSKDRLLARGQPLDEARHLLNAGFELTPVERSLIDASRRRVWQNRQIRRFGVAVLVVLTAVSVVGFILAERNRRQSELNFTEARKTVDEFVTDITREELSVIPGLQDIRQKFAQRAVDRYEQFFGRRPNDPEVSAGLALAKIGLGQVIGGIGSFDKGVNEIKEAIDLLDRVTSISATPENRTLLAKARTDLATLYWSNEDRIAALPLVESAVSDLEKLVHNGSSHVEAKYELGRAYNLRGNCRRELANDVDAGYADYLRAIDVISGIVEGHLRKVDCYQVLAAATHNLHFQSKSAKDYSGALALLDESRKYDLRILQLTPGSPQAMSNNSISLSNRAKILLLMGKKEEAESAYAEAETTSRKVVADNPKVTRFQALLADTLKSCAEHFTGQREFDAARRYYGEAISILESLVERVNDQPNYAVWLIEIRSALASFHSGTPETTGKRDEAAFVSALSETVKAARHCVIRFPRSPDVQYQLGKALYSQSEVDYDAKKWPAVEKLLSEACDIYTSRVASHVAKLNDERTIGYLQWLQRLAETATALKDRQLAERTYREAFALIDQVTESEGAQSLGVILGTWGRLCEESKDNQTAIAAYEAELRVSRVPFETMPWHWYLRSNVAGAYLHLSELYHRVGDVEKEVRARQEWLRIWGGYFSGMKTDTYIEPDPPPTEFEARRLREHMSKTPGMKRFTVPCDFNGLKHPFHVYISETPWPKDPLEDQAKWLEEIRGGKIPEEVRESFRKLHKIAHENKVSFQDLCVYALQTPEKEIKKETKDEK